MKRRGTPPKITIEKCTRCGQCVAVCPSFVIELVEDKATVVRGEWCMGCGHCGAVCPAEAILQEATSYENYPGQGSAPAASPETLGLLLRGKRSVRKYTEDPIPRHLLDKILEAGRHAPTGSNSQNVHYLTLTSADRILQLRNMTLGFYEKIFARARGKFGSVLLRLAAGRRTLEYLRESLPKVEHAYEQMKKGKDILFYHAPAVLIAHAESWDSSSPFNCSVALYNGSLMAHSLGLGCCFNGFLVNAANRDRKINTWLGIPPGHKCYAAMTIGYPAVKYRRLVRRESPKVTWG
jgi:nitroreductase/Pyruvate/2-oxoacid:ferredoxin oxidoreductase delta subunit